MRRRHTTATWPPAPAAIEALRPGKQIGAYARSRHAFADVARDDQGLLVECGWIVPEAYEDDPASCTQQPFGTPQPWVGRLIRVGSAEEARDTLERVYASVAAGRVVDEGKVIGSVIR